MPNTCEANAKGYNDAEYDYEKDPAIYRIVIIEIPVAARPIQYRKFWQDIGKEIKHQRVAS